MNFQPFQPEWQPCLGTWISIPFHLSMLTKITEGRGGVGDSMVKFGFWCDKMGHTHENQKKRDVLTREMCFLKQRMDWFSTSSIPQYGIVVKGTGWGGRGSWVKFLIWGGQELFKELENFSVFPRYGSSKLAPMRTISGIWPYLCGDFAQNRV